MKTASIIIGACVVAGALFAQQPQQKPAPPASKAGRSVAREESNVYKDSLEFAKTFTELFPLIAPKKNVRADAEDFLKRISKSFTMQGLDSAKAMAVALNGLDTNAYRKIYYDIYRKNLSAKELKKFLEFVKTPEGKKAFSVMPQLERAQSDASNYISRAINTNLGPLRQEARDKMMKERPPQKGGRVIPPGMQTDSTGRPIPQMRRNAPTMNQDSTRK